MTFNLCHHTCMIIIIIRTLEFVDPVPFPLITFKFTKLNKPKIAENVPASNCHPKVVIITVQEFCS